MVLPIFGLIIGLFIGTLLPFSMPMEYAKYLSVALPARWTRYLAAYGQDQKENLIMWCL